MRAAVLIVVVMLAAVAACIETSPARRRAELTPPTGHIDVIVSPSRGTPTMGADGPYTVVDAEGTTIHRGRGQAADTPVRARQTAVAWGRLNLGPAPVEVRPEPGVSLSVDGTSYRGVLRIEARGRTVIVNRLAVDEYLLGVVPSEMPDRFGLEALKAQAVAARTYALYEMGQRGRLKADQRSQVYKGMAAETLVTTRAVKQTAGQVLTRNGDLIPAWYHSTCGGSTTPAQLVFPDVPQGLPARGVSCPDCRSSPHYEWTRSFPASDVARALGMSPGDLDGVSAVTPRYPARPSRVVGGTGGGSRSLPVVDFRSRLSSGRPYSGQLLSTLWAHAPRLHGGRVEIQGRGWGHGVGMCQYGARGYAARGADHLDILQRYYPGARLAPAP